MSQVVLARKSVDSSLSNSHLSYQFAFKSGASGRRKPSPCYKRTAWRRRRGGVYPRPLFNANWYHFSTGSTERITCIRAAKTKRSSKYRAQLAELFGISEKTVCRHRDNIRKKLGLRGGGADLRTYLL